MVISKTAIRTGRGAGRDHRAKYWRMKAGEGGHDTNKYNVLCKLKTRRFPNPIKFFPPGRDETGYPIHGSIWLDNVVFVRSRSSSRVCQPPLAIRF